MNTIKKITHAFESIILWFITLLIFAIIILPLLWKLIRMSPTERTIFGEQITELNEFQTKLNERYKK